MGMMNLSDEELINTLRENVGVSLAAVKAAHLAADRIEDLQVELDLMKTAGVIEIASRNNRVTEYMFHWEGRALDAEAKLERTVALLKKAQTYITDLEDHEGAEGFSVSTNNFASEYYAALTELEKTE